MTRALCSRSSKRKAVKSSQEVIPEDCKENSPSILSQSTAKKTSAAKNRSNFSLKENISPMETTSSLSKSSNANLKNEIFSPVRKSVRRLKSSPKAQNKPVKILTKRSVLSDKTNSPRITVDKEQSCETLSLLDQKNDSARKLTPPIHNKQLKEQHISLKGETSNSKSHVPIYKNKTVGSLQISSESEHSQLEKKEGVYEFEVDENEEPFSKRKRKKRTYIRKPKIGPKALTINNIKYSSSESLVSLSDKPIALKKKTTKKIKSNLKPFSSVTNLNDSEDTCYSVKSFMSHPPSLLLCESKKNKSRKELSVLQETQSEECQSPVHHIVHVDIHVEPHLTPSPNVHSSVNELAISKVGALPSWHDIHFSPNPRCYVSSTSHTSNLNINSFSASHQNNTIPHQISSCSANISTSSTRDFLSSTPCKRMSLVVRDNSVFDDSCDLPRGLRPSTGFVKDASADISAETNDTGNCFGFDESEELEEPLVSPIKHSNINYVLPWDSPIRSNQIEKPKLNIQEVIQMLKSTIPKDTVKEASTVFDTSSERNNSLSKTNVDEDVLHPTVNFKKPPRRSYERQRRIQHHSDHEEEAEEEEKENAPQAVKICYKKTNTSKSTKPKKVTKAKQKIVKEEEEIEKLAAEMNAKFQEIEKVNLVVE